MSNEKSPAPRAPAGMEPIKIRELVFCVPEGRAVPLQNNDGGMSRILAGERKRSGGTWVEIQFEPWQRHHRVREFEWQGGKLMSEFCVPESWALYVPEPV